MTEPVLYVTHPSVDHDGFAEQFKIILYTMMFAELNGMTYLYRPLSKMDHNYHNDPDYIAKKEAFLGLREGIRNTSEQKTAFSINNQTLLHYIETNLTKCVQTKALQTVKDLFFAGKSSPFSASTPNIVMHIRRPNACDRGASAFAVPEAIYLEIFRSLLNTAAPASTFHIVSQGPVKEFEAFTNMAPELQLHLDEPVEEAFLWLCYADILVIAPSAFSYVAGIIGQASTIHYIQHCNPPWPLPSWRPVEGYMSPRQYHEYIITLPVFYDSLTDTYRPSPETIGFAKLIQDLAQNLPKTDAEPATTLPFNGNPDHFGEQFLAPLLRDLEITTIVETGTYLGNTTAWFATKCPEVHTIDNHEPYYRGICRAQNPAMIPHFGNSPDVLKLLLERFQAEAKTHPRKIMFYLDAHWGTYLPLLDELLEIAGHAVTQNQCLIVIDDFQIPDRPDIPHDSYKGEPFDFPFVKNELRKAIPDLYYEYYAPPPGNLSQTRGRLIAYPQSWLKEVLNRRKDRHRSF